MDDGCTRFAGGRCGLTARVALLLTTSLCILLGCDDRRDGGQYGQPGDADTSVVARDVGDVSRETGDPGEDVTDATTPDSDAQHPNDAPDTDADQDICAADCDFDGLTDCEERNLGTDPCDHDTDGDGLNDAREIVRGTDPLMTDTDGDGASDAEELAVGLDPTGEDTLGDGILDGERWIVGACEPAESEALDEHASAAGGWRVALPPAVSDYTELQIAGATSLNRQAAARFDDPTNEVSGFALSYRPSSSTATPEAVNRDLGAALSQEASVHQDFYATTFETHDGYKAARAEFLVEPSSPMSTKAFRNRLLFAFAPFSQSDVTHPGSASGATHEEFRVVFSTILREERGGDTYAITTAALAPATRYATQDRVKFRVLDLTNTTATSLPNDTVETRCRTHPAREQAKVDFYWVFNYTADMLGIFDGIQAVVQALIPRLERTTLDYRLGVTSMGRAQEGRLHNPPGWHLDPQIFQTEVHLLDSGFAPQSPPAQEWPFEAAYKGLRYMLDLGGTTPPVGERIRDGAQVVTIFVGHEDPYTIRKPSLALHTLEYYLSFLEQHTTIFSLVPDHTPDCDAEGHSLEAYHEAARRTGGGIASLCVRDVQETLDKIIDQTQGDVSPYVLPDVPVSSTLRVYINGQWVPRSREDGFDYAPSSNAIAFYGTYRPLLQTNERTVHTIAVHYDRWKHRIKEDVD